MKQGQQTEWEDSLLTNYFHSQEEDEEERLGDEEPQGLEQDFDQEREEPQGWEL